MGDEDITTILMEEFGSKCACGTGHSCGVKVLYSGIMRISNPHGEIDYRFGGGFGNPIADKFLIQSYIKASNVISGRAVASGDSNFVTAAMAWGDKLGVEVAPEIWGTEYNTQTTLWCAPIFAAAWYLASFIFPVWQAGAVGLVVTICIGCGVVRPLLLVSSHRQARREGQRYRDLLPNVHGSDYDE